MALIKANGQQGLQDVLRKHDIEIGKLLGSGAFANVFSGRVTVKGKVREAAVKIYTSEFTNLSRADIVATAQQEIAACGHLKHPNIVETYAFICTPHLVCMCLELLSNDLFSHIVPSKGLPAHKMMTVLTGILKGLRYLHEDAMKVHLDLKAENILMTASGEPKIADFDTCQNSEEWVPVARGTRDFHPPELIGPSDTGFVVRPSADIWAFGTLMYLLLKGSYAWDTAVPSDGRYRAFVAQRDAPVHDRDPSDMVWAGLPARLFDVLCMCWRHDESTRATAGSLLHEIDDDDVEAHMMAFKSGKRYRPKPGKHSSRRIPRLFGTRKTKLR